MKADPTRRSSLIPRAFLLGMLLLCFFALEHTAAKHLHLQAITKQTSCDCKAQPKADCCNKKKETPKEAKDALVGELNKAIE